MGRWDMERWDMGRWEGGGGTVVSGWGHPHGAVHLVAARLDCKKA